MYAVMNRVKDELSKMPRHLDNLADRVIDAEFVAMYNGKPLMCENGTGNLYVVRNNGEPSQVNIKQPRKGYYQLSMQ